MLVTDCVIVKRKGKGADEGEIGERERERESC